METVYAIRHRVVVEGVPIRRVAREFGVSRNTVRRYLAGASPGVRRPGARACPVLEAVRPRMEALLAEAPRWTHGKQRLTATQLHRLLVAEGFVVGAPLVKAYVAEHRRQRREVFVPLVYAPGELAEVDFFEVVVTLAGTRTKAWLFVLRLMHSGRDFAWLYDRQDQVAFLDGHVRAFAHLGGVPQRVLYDNLRPAVARIVRGAPRVLTARMQALATHYLFEPCFARPGTGHDKGGVESRGRAIRWQELVPIPAGPDLAAISAALLARLDARMATSRDAAGHTIAERFAAETAHLLPLPARPFAAAAVRVVPVSRRALVQLEGAVYSVPCAWAGRELTAHVGATTVTVVGPDATRIAHPRGRFGTRTIDYRHYLPELARKPQAVRQVATPLVATLGPPFARVWAQLVAEHGGAEAGRRFARVLACIVERGVGPVAAQLTAALDAGEPPLRALGGGLPVAPPPRCPLPPSVHGIEVLAARAADYDALLEAAS